MGHGARRELCFRNRSHADEGDAAHRASERARYDHVRARRQYAFVCSSFTPELAVIDVASHKIIKRLPQVSPFSPNIAVTPENDEVWITLKDVGKVQIYSAKPPFEQKAVLDTGPITNHVNFANNRNGKFAYVTIGGANEVKRSEEAPRRN